MVDMANYTNQFLEAYGASNRVLVQPRLKWVEMEVLDVNLYKLSPTGVVLETYTKAIKLTRHCTLEYQYVGMTSEAAETCRDNMVRYYTRRQYNSIFSSDEGEFYREAAGNTPMANVTVSHIGNMYAVNVRVEEIDTLSYIEEAQQFTEEDTREYEI